eukprot:3084265-Pyramimonas_sp.AAC.1
MVVRRRALKERVHSAQMMLLQCLTKETSIRSSDNSAFSVSQNCTQDLMAAARPRPPGGSTGA